MTLLHIIFKDATL